MNPGEPRFWPPPGPLLSPRFLEAGRWPKASGNLQLIWRPKVGLWRARVGGPVWEPRGPLPAQAQSQSQLSPLCLKGQKSLSQSRGRWSQADTGRTPRSPQGLAWSWLKPQPDSSSPTVWVWVLVTCPGRPCFHLLPSGTSRLPLASTLAGGLS